MTLNFRDPKFYDFDLECEYLGQGHSTSSNNKEHCAKYESVQ